MSNIKNILNFFNISNNIFLPKQLLNLQKYDNIARRIKMNFEDRAKRLVKQQKSLNFKHCPYNSEGEKNA